MLGMTEYEPDHIDACRPITLTLQQYSRLSDAFVREIKSTFSRQDG